jgi:hypothetical protein
LLIQDGETTRALAISDEMASDTEQPSTDTPTSSLDDASSRRLPPATPVFANPFLTPFLPQAMPQVDATNPGGYFLSASQYQELMQHYLHSLAAAAAVSAKDEVGMTFAIKARERSEREARTGNFPCACRLHRRMSECRVMPWRSR